MKRRKTNRKIVRWTPEEDDVIRNGLLEWGLADLQREILERTGVHRTQAAILRRRGILNPDFRLEPDGWIRLLSIAGLGANADKVSPEALRAAKAARALRVMRISGRDVLVVKAKWADEWLAYKAQQAAEYDRAIENGWIATKEIIRQLGKNKFTFYSQLRNAIEKDVGLLRPLAKVPRLLTSTKNQTYLWEPEAARRAIEEIKNQVRVNRMMRREMWSSKKVASFLNSDLRAVRDGFGQFRSLLDLPTERNTRGWRYWNPADVVAWAKANGFQTGEGE